MVLEKLKARRKEQGFTLVELLIVIVVIAILAAITIVAYGNVTAKAHDSGYQSDASNIVSYIEAYNADMGSYPTGATSGDVSPADTQGATAKLPSSLYIIAQNAGKKPTGTTATALAISPTTNTCTSVTAGTATAWAECSFGGKNYYQVEFNSDGTGACVWYPQMTGTGDPQVHTAIAGKGTC